MALSLGQSLLRSCCLAAQVGGTQLGLHCFSLLCRGPSRRIFILRVKILGGNGQTEKSGISTSLAGREKVAKV